MLTAELVVAVGRDQEATLAEVNAALGEIDRWQDRLPYYRRDIAECIMTRPGS